MNGSSSPTRPRRRLLAVGGVATAILLGGGGVALASGSGTPSPTPPAGSTTSSGASTPRVHTPKLDGTVTSVNGSTILITDRDGFTRTIKTSGSTTYGAGITASPAPGTRVHATGTVDADGTSLDATTVVTAPTPPAGGKGKHGAGPKPGPREGAESPDAPSPSGAPTPPTGSAAPSGSSSATPGGS